ncbi:MAG: biopolymer transporter ExbD [Candidatus Omnitrophica bacterium]|nr:biopolymer transporter ExbD [Candidatus Omnitrophota bacterium]
MNRSSRKQKLVSEINITPFTDVILVLLVIFMVSTPLIYQTNIKVKLPEVKSGSAQRGPADEVDLTITSENVIYLNKDVVTRKELKAKLADLQKNKPELNVVLRVDRLVYFKDLVEILDMMTELKITRFDISAVKRP